MANVKHAGRKRKITSDDKARAYQRRQSKQAKKVQKGLKSLQQTPPNHLDLVAKRLWRSIAPELIKIGNIKQLDCVNLEALCTTYSIYLKAEKDYEEYGSFVETEKGSLMKNPAISIVSECARNMKSLSADLGISFNSRIAQNVPSENYHAADHTPTPLKLVKFDV